jgi:DNA replication factor GINS
MERSNLIETLEQLLESEERSERLTKLPSDIYARIAVYSQKLRKGAGVDEDDTRARITRKQLQLIKGMVKQLIDRRLVKSTELQDTRELLPEERYIYESYERARLVRDKFAKALINGQPSFFAILQKQQMQKMVTVRFAKPLGEIMGFDLNRYGPFKVHDIAQIPAANADALISNGDALEVSTKDS